MDQTPSQEASTSGMAEYGGVVGCPIGRSVSGEQALMRSIESPAIAEQRYAMLVAVARRMVPTLARRGVVVLPDDLDDAVHELWIAANASEDRKPEPEVTAVAAYFSKSLFRFVLRTKRRQRRFVQLFDSDWLDSQVFGGTEQCCINAYMKIRLQEVMNQRLELRRTQLVLRFFEEGPRSVRRLSREFSMTRHRVREEILNGVGIILVQLSDLSEWHEPERNVARGIWGQSLSFAEAAMQLHLPLAEVRSHHRNNLIYLRNLILSK